MFTLHPYKKYVVVSYSCQNYTLLLDTPNLHFAPKVSANAKIGILISGLWQNKETASIHAIRAEKSTYE